MIINRAKHEKREPSQKDETRQQSPPKKAPYLDMEYDIIDDITSGKQTSLSLSPLVGD
jgi:hypothetical protein